MPEIDKHLQLVFAELGKRDFFYRVGGDGGIYGDGWRLWLRVKNGSVCLQGWVGGEQPQPGFALVSQRLQPHPSRAVQSVLDEIKADLAVWLSAQARERTVAEAKALVETVRKSCPTACGLVNAWLELRGGHPVIRTENGYWFKETKLFLDFMQRLERMGRAMLHSPHL